MKNLLFLATALIFIIGCDKKEEPKEHYDVIALTQNKCATCHNLAMPAYSTADEKAPPMMAVVFHLKDFIKVNVPSQHQEKFVSFVNDYVMNPSKSKSYCDKDSLEQYGLMPSQKNNITKGELNAVSNYLYHEYDAKRFYKEQAEINRIKNLPIQERLFEQKRCKNCHEIDKDKIAPSFQNIAKRYTIKDKNILIESMKNGSKGKWQQSKIPMPPYTTLTKEELEKMSDWILSLK